MDWSVETVDGADSGFAALPAKLRARLVCLPEMVENEASTSFEPHVRHLEGKLWELPANSWDAITRAICVTATGRPVVVPHVFTKTSQRTPRQAFATAIDRMKPVKPWRT